jgi:hypothetical protein
MLKETELRLCSLGDVLIRLIECRGVRAKPLCQESNCLLPSHSHERAGQRRSRIQPRAPMRSNSSFGCREVLWDGCSRFAAQSTAVLYGALRHGVRVVRPEVYTVHARRRRWAGAICDDLPTARDSDAGAPTYRKLLRIEQRRLAWELC